MSEADEGSQLAKDGASLELVTSVDMENSNAMDVTLDALNASRPRSLAHMVLRQRGEDSRQVTFAP